METTMSDQILNAAVESLIGGTSGQIVVCQGAGSLASTSALKTVGGSSLLGSGDIAVGSGDVVGPSSSTDNAIARFDATTGKLLQNCVVTIGDTGNIAGLGTVSCGAITASGGITATGGGISGTDGWKGGSYGGGYGAIWPASVTPGLSNFSFLFNANQTEINGGGGSIILGTSGAGRGHVRNDGTLGAATDSTYDIGETAARRPRNVYVAGAITASGLMCAGVYTLATVPSASSNTGKFLRVSDRSQKHAYSDGTNWRFFGDDAIIS